MNDPFFSDQQYLQAVEVPAVWSITTGDSNQKIAIIGGGNVFPSHEDLGAKTTVRTQGHLEGLPGQPIPFDDQPSLGTVAGGMAAALTNNGLGVAGVNWNASILSYNPAVLDFDPDLNVASNIQVLDLGAVDESFDMARSDGADLIVAPLTVFSDADPGVTVETDLGEEPIEVLGVTIPAWVVGAGESIFGLIRDGLSFNSPWNDAHFAARNVVATGHPLIAPAGNFEGSAYTFPASTARNEIAISVGSTDNFKNPSQFSGSSLSSSPLGATVDVVAPGENVKTTVNTGPSAYKTVSTTSASAGLVAGVASLLQSYDPAMAPATSARSCAAPPRTFLLRVSTPRPASASSTRRLRSTTCRSARSRAAWSPTAQPCRSLTTIISISSAAHGVPFLQDRTLRAMSTKSPLR